MREFLFPVERGDGLSLQAQIRQAIEKAVASGRFVPGDPAPSTRRLASALGVSRNTVSLAFQALVDQGVLEARERSGYYIADGGVSAPAEKRRSGGGLTGARGLPARRAGSKPSVAPSAGVRRSFRSFTASLTRRSSRSQNGGTRRDALWGGAGCMTGLRIGIPKMIRC